MPRHDDIESLERRTLGELDAVYDYKEHTTVIWRLFQRWVQQGHALKSTNVDTGNVVTEQDLVGLAQRYNSEYLPEFTFQHIVVLSENFLFDLLRLLNAEVHGRRHRTSRRCMRLPDG